MKEQTILEFSKIKLNTFYNGVFLGMGISLICLGEYSLATSLAFFLGVCIGFDYFKEIRSRK